MSCSSAAAMTSASRTEPPGCTIARTPGLGRLIDAVAEGEVRVRSEHGAGRRVAGERRLVRGEEGRVHARHLPGADPDRRAVTRQHDRVRLDRRHRAPREQQVAVLVVGRLALGHQRPPCVVDDRWRALLHQHAAAHPLVVEIGCPSCRRRRRPSSTRRFFLRPRISTAPALNSGATMHSTNRLDTASAVASSTGTVNAITEPNAETGSQASALLVRVERGRADGEPARRRVLHDRAGRLRRERIDGEQRALEVEQVVERQLLSAALREPGESRARALDVERGRLAGVLAVAQRLRALERDDDRLPGTCRRARCANHDAMAASYAAVCAKTLPASRRRRSRSSSPASSARGTRA